MTDPKPLEVMPLHQETLSSLRLGHCWATCAISLSCTNLQSLMLRLSRYWELTTRRIRVSSKLQTLVIASYQNLDCFYSTLHSELSLPKFSRWQSLSLDRLRKGQTILIICYSSHCSTSISSSLRLFYDFIAISSTSLNSIMQGFTTSFCMGLGMYLDRFWQVNYMSFFITIRECNLLKLLLINQTSSLVTHRERMVISSMLGKHKEQAKWTSQLSQQISKQVTDSTMPSVSRLSKPDYSFLFVSQREMTMLWGFNFRIFLLIHSSCRVRYLLSELVSYIVCQYVEFDVISLTTG